MSLGAIPVSLDLLIFSPPTNNQPCANTFFGIATFAAINIAGQITAWNRRISFPTKCTSAGQVFANFLPPSESGSSPSPTAVA